jgi:general secretion pathway protein K
VRPDGAAKTLRQRGWALISVLWALAILTMLVAAAQTLSFSSAQRERRALDAARADAVLDASVVRAVLGITDPRPRMRWRVDGVAQAFGLDGQTIHVTVQDEFGRIDLNAADGSLLNQLLRSAGLSEDGADALTDNILDWRTLSSDFRRLHGASAADYAKAGLAWRPRYGAFQSVDELRLVLGMTPALFARIRPALTVYSHHPAIDDAVAPREALLAYYPNQPDRVGLLLAKRSEAGSANSTAGRAGTLAEISNLSGRVFDIVVEMPPNLRAGKREAIVMLTNADSPIVMAWH